MIPLRGSSTIFNLHIRLHHLYRRIQDLPRQKGGDYAIEYSTNRLYSTTEAQHRDLTSPRHTFLLPLWSIPWSFKNISCIETSMTSIQLLLCSSTSQSSRHSLHPYQSRLHFLKFEYLMSPAAFPSSAHAPSSSIAWGDATQAGNSGGKRQTMLCFTKKVYLISRMLMRMGGRLLYNILQPFSLTALLTSSIPA